MNVATNLQVSPAAVTGLPSTTPDAQGTGLAATTGGATTAVSMVESRSADITLETTEGDRVTLSFSSETEVGYQVYNAQGGLDGAPPARLETFTLSSGSEMTIVIDGEISEAEKADIETVMSAVKEMAEEFFEGDVDEALAELLEMGETTSIAGLQVSLETSRSFSVSYGETAAPAVQDAGAGGPQAVAADAGSQAGATAGTQTAAGSTTQAPPATPPATAASSTGTAASGAPATPPAADPNTQAAPAGPAAAEAAVDPAAQTGRITVDSLRDFVSSMTGTVGGAGIDLSKAGKHMLKIFDHLLDEIAEDIGFGEDKQKVAEVVKAELADQIEELADHAAHEAHEAHEEGFAREMKDAEKAHGHDHEDKHDHGHEDKHGHGDKHGH